MKSTLFNTIEPKGLFNIQSCRLIGEICATNDVEVSYSWPYTSTEDKKKLIEKHHIEHLCLLTDSLERFEEVSETGSVKKFFRLPFTGNFRLLYLQVEGEKGVGFPMAELVPSADSRPHSIVAKVDDINEGMDLDERLKRLEELVEAVNKEIDVYNDQCLEVCDSFFAKRYQLASLIQKENRDFDYFLLCGEGSISVIDGYKANGSGHRRHGALDKAESRTINLILTRFLENYANSSKTYLKEMENCYRDMAYRALCSHPALVKARRFEKAGKSEIRFEEDGKLSLLIEFKIWRGFSRFESDIEALVHSRGINKSSSIAVVIVTKTMRERSNLIGHLGSMFHEMNANRKPGILLGHTSDANNVVTYSALWETENFALPLSFIFVTLELGNAMFKKIA